MKIALCTAPVQANYTQVESNRWPPLWAMSLASVCRDFSEVDAIRYFDGTCIPLDLLIGKLLDFSPDILALSPVLISYPNDIEIAREIKRAIPCQVIFGGHHVTNLADLIVSRHKEVVDAVVTGDGEPALRAFLSSRQWEGAPNVVIFANNKIHRGSSEQINLDTEPISAIEEIRNYVRYRRQYIFSQKGCPIRAEKGRCVFCSRIDEGIRFKSTRRVAKELKYYKSIAGPPISVFDVSDDFLASHTWIKSLEDALDEAGMLGTPLVIFASAQRVSVSIVKILKRIGVKDVILGFEAADARGVSAAGKKGASLATNKQAARLLLQAGINVIASYVFGLPGVNAGTIESCFKQVNRLQKEVGQDYASFSGYANVLIPFPGSPLFEKTCNMFPYLRNEDILDQREIQLLYLRACCDLKSGKAESFLEQLYSWSDNMNRQSSSTWIESLGLRNLNEQQPEETGQLGRKESSQQKSFSMEGND